MSSERALWGAVKGHMAPYMRLVRVENKVEKGTPDVYWRARGQSGWLELKHEAAWPMPLAPMKCKSLKLEQVLWLEAEEQAGGKAFVLFQVAKSYLLLRPSVVHRLYRGELYRDDPHILPLPSNNGFPIVALFHALVHGATV